MLNCAIRAQFNLLLMVETVMLYLKDEFTLSPFLLQPFGEMA